MHLDGRALSAASHLSQLHHLQLMRIGNIPEPLKLQDLPSSLTYLSLMGCLVSAGDTLGSGRRLLAELRQLQLEKMSYLPPAALRLMPQLYGVTCIESELHDGMRFYQRGHLVCGSHAEQLCSTLPDLKHLQHIELSGFCHPLEAAGYTALTAGTQLTALIMANWSPPPGAARHMFAPGRKLPGLQRLQIRVADNFRVHYSHSYSVS
jgi:hypothetical protein